MRRLHAVAVAVAVLAVAACGSSGKPSPNAAGTGGAASNAPGKPGASMSATTGPGGSGTTSGGTATPGAPGGTTRPGASGQSTGATPSSTPNARTTDGSIHPSHVATAQELPITATVTPSCVFPGTAVTLRVTTKPNAAIAYVAIYNGDKSGAAPPWGEGYGGNDKGDADGSGKWSSTWTVSATAPSGPARVMLVVGANGKQRSIDVPFTVGEREVGGCGT